MRNLEDIENDLAAAREALSSAEGTPAEVYSRIVGYYRSVRNWNRGKREEYNQRRLYCIRTDEAAAVSPSLPAASELLLFVRPACPGCTPAKAAAEKLRIPVSLINADTKDGMEEAVRRNVMSTPTAILVSQSGKELSRAHNANSIGSLLASQPLAV